MIITMWNVYFDAFLLVVICNCNYKYKIKMASKSPQERLQAELNELKKVQRGMFSPLVFIQL